MIYTSYYYGFFSTKNIPDKLIPVSISCSIPLFCKEKVKIVYHPLVPEWSLVQAYKNRKTFTKELYHDFYFAHLQNLEITPEKVINELKDNMVLLCWENPSLFCHRHLVSSWLNKANFYCKELDLKQFQRKD